MHILFSIFHKEWNDYFDSSITHALYENKSKELNITTSDSYYVSRCLFIYLNSTGAIRITDTTGNNLKFLIDMSSFDRCEHKDEIGGSLYIKSSKGECIQDRICSFGSNTPKLGTYCYISLSGNSPFKNYLLDSTISSSGYENYNGHRNVYLSYGETSMNSINISNSNLLAFCLYDITFNLNSSIRFSTFSNNTTTSKSYPQAYLYTFSMPIEMKIFFSNYFNNECSHLIGCANDLYFINCNFYNNNVTGHYFFVYDEQIELRGCYLDILDPSKDGSLIITENVSSIYPVNHHLSSGLCFAELPLEFTKKRKRNKYRN